MDCTFISTEGKFNLRAAGYAGIPRKSVRGGELPHVRSSLHSGKQPVTLIETVLTRK